VDYLASGEAKIEYVPPAAAAALADPAKATEGKRKVSFGSIPDFKFQGEGIKLSGVIPGSPADQSGMQEGDLITAFGDAPVADLTDYSEAMKRFAPGDVVTVDFLRDGVEMQVEVTLTERR
jgi:S1-C subfamily serine protease